MFVFVEKEIGVFCHRLSKVVTVFAFAIGCMTILNQQTSHTSSVCRESVGHIDGDIDTCTLYYAHSLMVLNDTLYVGEYQRIRKVQG